MYYTPVAVLLIIILLIALIILIFTHEDIQEDETQAPGPRTFPIIGNLHVLGGYEVPYQAFTKLREKYGEVIKLQLGVVKAMVVNGQDNIREVLINKGMCFDARPNFERYHKLFDGDKENSLAFCDFSELQKMRREMLRTHTFPRSFSVKFTNLDSIISTEVSSMIQRIPSSKTMAIKPLILQTCANIFLGHFCSKNFSVDDEKFLQMITDFDEIFYEVNQGYAADFLPFLMPLHKNRLKYMSKLTHRIRLFIEENIIENRYQSWEMGSKTDDYVENLIYHVKTEQTPKMSWDTALFALEDIIGGHAAVGNFVTKILGYLVKEPNVQKNIQKEIDVCTEQNKREVAITDRTSMPYTEATILEAIRLIASPIVPRVASQDTTVAGFKVEKDTLVFLNNYDLSMSEKFWTEPEKFQPERFLKHGRLVKPEHFLPFGGGRRSCMGYKMVQLLSFGIVSTLMQNFDILPVKNEVYKVPVGSLALPIDTFKFVFEKRCDTE